MRAAARARIEALHLEIQREITREKLHLTRNAGLDSMRLHIAHSRCDYMAMPVRARENMVWATTHLPKEPT